MRIQSVPDLPGNTLQKTSTVIRAKREQLGLRTDDCLLNVSDYTLIRQSTYLQEYRRNAGALHEESECTPCPRARARAPPSDEPHTGRSQWNGHYSYER